MIRIVAFMGNMDSRRALCSFYCCALDILSRLFQQPQPSAVIEHAEAVVTGRSLTGKLSAVALPQQFDQNGHVFLTMAGGDGAFEEAGDELWDFVVDPSVQGLLLDSPQGCLPHA